MSKKLQNDDISLGIDIRAQQAEETIHRLTKNIENLRKQNTEHRKEISRLAATEGDYSTEIKRLNEEIRKNAKEIEANKRSIQSERSEIDLSRMSAADLGKELKRLNKELANTSKSLHREEYTYSVDEATDSTDAWSQANREASKQYGEQKGKIEALMMVGENENLSLECRKELSMSLKESYLGITRRLLKLPVNM